MTSKSSGAARKSAASPTAAAVMWTTSPEAAPTAAKNPARGPLLIPVASANSMSGPGRRMRIVTVTRYAPKSEPFTPRFCRNSRLALDAAALSCVTGRMNEVEAHQHGLRTPIAAIAGLADAALKRDDLDRDLIKQLRAIRQLATDALAALGDRDEPD